MKNTVEDFVDNEENASKQQFFPFLHHVFYPFQERFQFYSHIHFVIYKCFQVILVLILLPHHKFPDRSKLKAFADEKLLVPQVISFIDWEENTVGKGENAGNQHFLLFPHCFQSSFSPGLLKVVSGW